MCNATAYAGERYVMPLRARAKLMLTHGRASHGKVYVLIGAKAMNDDFIIEARNLHFAYDDGEEHSLKGVDLKIRRGKKTAFMGANGSGKSTFFLCCNGILRPALGELIFNGQPLRYDRKSLLELRRRVGIVFQDPDNQLFCASVYQEISFGILNLGIPEDEARQEVEQVIEYLDITPFRQRPAQSLSGGQKKQVSIADILVMKPDVIILDEPAAALDPRHTKMVNAIVDRLADNGITILMATHDIDYALQWADEIVLMHEGRVLAQGDALTICENEALLAKTNLEVPGILQLYQRLCKKNILRKEGTPPRNLRELETLIENI